MFTVNLLLVVSPSSHDAEAALALLRQRCALLVFVCVACRSLLSWEFRATPSSFVAVRRSASFAGETPRTFVVGTINSSRSGRDVVLSPLSLLFSLSEFRRRSSAYRRQSPVAPSTKLCLPSSLRKKKEILTSYLLLATFNFVQILHEIS
jgi:hypothetical protein